MDVQLIQGYIARPPQLSWMSLPDYWEMYYGFKRGIAHLEAGRFITVDELTKMIRLAKPRSKG